METWILQFSAWLGLQGVEAGWAEALARVLAFTGMIALAFAANWVAKRVIVRAVRAFASRTSTAWDDILVSSGVFTRLSHLAPALVIDALGGVVLGENHESLAVLENATTLYLIFITLLVLSALLDAVQRNVPNAVPLLQHRV